MNIEGGTLEGISDMWEIRLIASPPVALFLSISGV